MNELTTNVRHRQWLAMIREQKASGQTIAAWCSDQGISQHCFYYRQQKLRELLGSEIPTFVEIQKPQSVASPNLDNTNSAASIQAGRITFSLSNQASEELISRIVRVLNAQPNG